MKKWERLNELEAEQEKLKEKVREENRLPIGGKATKMGVQYPMDFGKRKKDAEKAYDKLQNMREQEIENNAVKIKELRKELYGSDAAKFHIMSAEDRKQDIEDKFNQQKFRKGGVVYANCGASVKPAQKAKK
jgi:hypothetical protein